MDQESLRLNLANAERTASGAMARLQAHRGLIFRMQVLGISSTRLSATLGVLEQTHDICTAEVRRLRAALAALPRH